MKQNVVLHLPCARGIENCVEKELEALGALDIRAGHGVVHCSGDVSLVARANVFSRCASRVLWEEARFDGVTTPEDLMDALSRVPFETRLDDRGTFSVDAHVKNTPWTHSHYAALKVKDAIVDRFRALSRPRPNVDTERPSLRYVLHWDGQVATLSLDTSGDPLTQRGYRQGVEGVAPIKETLAASILALAHADVKRPFLDPVCGTGTLVIEQVWRMLRRAPGRDRRFGFERWQHRAPELDRALALARIQARDEELHTTGVPVHASDWHRDAIDAATQCFQQAGISQHVKLERMDARTAPMPGDRPVVVGNLPYGERLSPNVLQLDGFYRTLGEHLAACANARVILLTLHARGRDLLNLDAHAHLVRTWQLRAGDLPIDVLRYDISDPNFVRSNKPRA